MAEAPLKAVDPAEVAAQPVVQASGKVIVACKIANGLVLRLHTMVEMSEPVLGGGYRTVMRAQVIGDPVHIRGPAAPFGVMPRYAVIGGYALTDGVDGDFWRAWMEQNKTHQAVVNGLIFAHTKEDAARGMSADQEEIRSGMEPITPDKDPRLPRPLNRNLSPLKPDTTKAA